MYNKNDGVLSNYPTYTIRIDIYIYIMFHAFSSNLPPASNQNTINKTKLPRGLVGFRMKKHRELGRNIYPDPGLSYKRRRWTVAIPQAESTLIQQVAHGFIPTLYLSSLKLGSWEKMRKTNNNIFCFRFPFFKDVWWLELGSWKQRFHDLPRVAQIFWQVATCSWLVQ